jgi:hypothetical protein
MFGLFTSKIITKTTESDESIFSLSTTTKGALLIFGIGFLLYGVGHALRPVADIVETLDDDSDEEKKD